MLLSPLAAASPAPQATPLRQDYPQIVKCVGAHLVVIEEDKVPRPQAEPRVIPYVQVAHTITPADANFDPDVVARRDVLRNMKAGMAAFSGDDVMAGIRKEAAECDRRWAANS